MIIHQNIFNRSVLIKEIVYSDVWKGCLCWSVILMCFMVRSDDDDDDNDDDDNL